MAYKIWKTPTSSILLVLLTGGFSFACGYNNRQADIWRDDIGFVNAAFRTGSESFHTTFFFGARARGSTRFTAGLGVCRQIGRAQDAFSEIETTFQTFDKNIFQLDERILLARIRLNGGWRLGGTMAVYGGPAINYHLYEGDTRVKKSAPWQRKSGKLKHLFWPGFTAGLRF